LRGAPIRYTTTTGQTTSIKKIFITINKLPGLSERHFNLKRNKLRR
jgi:hypothetical protein